MNLLRRKSFDDLLAHTQEKKLTKALGAFDITLMGLGIIIGTGIFCPDGYWSGQICRPWTHAVFCIRGHYLRLCLSGLFRTGIVSSRIGELVYVRLRIAG